MKKNKQKHNDGNFGPVSYDNILHLLKRGIISKKEDIKHDLPFAIEHGRYMGCPGKEMYYSIPSLSPEQLNSLVPLIAKAFPQQPPHGSVQYSVFWRYFYGVFIKRGLLNSENTEIDKLALEWPVYFDLVNKVLIYYKANYHAHFGQVVTTELLAHRLGDLMVLSHSNNNPDYAARKEDMISRYNEAHNTAIKVGAKKNAFSTLYWCSMYLFAAKDNELFLKYGIQFLQSANQFATSVTTKSKVVSTLNRLHNVADENQWKQIVKMYRNFNNKVMKSFGFVKLNFDKKILGV